VLTIEELRQKSEEGLALSREARAAIEADDQRVREEQAAQAQAKRITENLATEPKLRAEAEEALADLRSIIASFGPAVEKAIEARDRHEAICRALRSDGESCASIPSLKVQGIKDRGLYHDLDKLRLAQMRDF
jgi:hypothetical protein